MNSGNSNPKSTDIVILGANECCDYISPGAA